MLENALRIFESKMTKPQYKAIKTIVKWIWKQSTTVLAKLHEHEIMHTKKFTEKISYHLGNVELLSVVQKKSVMCATKVAEIAMQEGKPVIISVDESDIFKPDANCMPWLSMIRDGSTGLIGNGYIFRGVNINGVSLISELDEEKAEKKGKVNISKTIKLIEETERLIGKDIKGTYVLDRGWDSIELIDYLLEKDHTFIIRMRKNRKVIDVKSWEKKKISDFVPGLHVVDIEWDTRVVLCVAKRKWFREPILLITNDVGLDESAIVSSYLKRWKIEEDFNKMKSLGLEEVRVLSLYKIKNLMAIIQFIIVLSQDIFNEVMNRNGTTYEHIYLYYKKYATWKSLTLNPSSFIRFVSENLLAYSWYNSASEPDYWLFSSKVCRKKLGIL